jgi:hypothetical protein
MTDYMKVREAFMTSNLDLNELEALRGLIECEIRYEELQTKLWTIAGKYRLDLRDQFAIIKLALESNNIRVSADCPTLTDPGSLSWPVNSNGMCQGRLNLDIDGTWSIRKFKYRAVDAPVYSLTDLLARRKTNISDWKIAG